SVNIDYNKNKKIKKMYAEIPSISFERINAAAQMMYAVTNHIVEKQYINFIQEKFNNSNLKLLESITLRTDLERALKEAELRALQSQINPHFLFNVLNTIGRLALIENATKTENMIYHFSDMMRYTLKKNSNQSVTLREEISHVNNYLSIQKFRLGDRLNYKVKIPEKYYTIECPFMTIQPLVENSIKYVVEKKIEGGNIIIEAFEKDENIILSVKDDGDGLSKEDIDRALNGDIYNENENSGIGIYNVHKRLIYSYGSDNGLKIKSLKGKGTTILITLSKK
ncbi:MAG: histidine kinase, partial [Bacillota bacterium]|nr:histidine kinase [Bacillota bacterium]